MPTNSVLQCYVRKLQAAKNTAKQYVDYGQKHLDYKDEVRNNSCILHKTLLKLKIFLLNYYCTIAYAKHCYNLTTSFTNPIFERCFHPFHAAKARERVPAKLPESSAVNMHLAIFGTIRTRVSGTGTGYQ